MDSTTARDAIVRDAIVNDNVNCAKKYDINSLPSKQNKFFVLARSEAQNSKMLSQLGAVFAHNGSPVATGCNDGMRQRFSKQNTCSTHAELAVLWQVVPGTHQIKWYEKGA